MLLQTAAADRLCQAYSEHPTQKQLQEQQQMTWQLSCRQPLQQQQQQQVEVVLQRQRTWLLLLKLPLLLVVLLLCCLMAAVCL
jgi:hypothetical protein